jgi:hypothetical protein
VWFSKRRRRVDPGLSEGDKNEDCLDKEEYGF